MNRSSVANPATFPKSKHAGGKLQRRVIPTFGDELPEIRWEGSAPIGATPGDTEEKYVKDNSDNCLDGYAEWYKERNRASDDKW
jgi:hypothetical protein